MTTNRPNPTIVALKKNHCSEGESMSNPSSHPFGHGEMDPVAVSVWAMDNSRRDSVDVLLMDPWAKIEEWAWDCGQVGKRIGC